MNEIEPSRKDWEKDKISNWVKESYLSQVRMCEHLEGIYPDFTLDYPRDFSEERGEPFDLTINGKVKIELECGLNQSQWVNSIYDNKDRWWGLNVLSRKSGKDRWDIFLKYNSTLSSFFAISREYLNDVGIVKEGIDHNLPMKTDNTVIYIGWDNVVDDKRKMVYDNYYLLHDMIEERL